MNVVPITTRFQKMLMVVGAGLLIGVTPVFADDAITLDPALKGYLKVSGVSGNVNSIG